MKKLILYLDGPSGGGKDTLISALEAVQQPVFRGCRRETTRSKYREDDDLRYRFLTETQFSQRLNDGHYVLVNNYAGHWYAVPITEINAVLDAGMIPVIKGTVESFVNSFHEFTDIFPDTEVVSCYMFPESMVEWERRLRGRATESEAQIQARIRESLRDMEIAEQSTPAIIHHRIVSKNGCVHLTVDEIVKLLEEVYLDK